jgi:hypothetical protein
MSDIYSIQLGIFPGYPNTWTTFFDYIKGRYRSVEKVKRIDCLRIQTDVIIQVNYILEYGYIHGMRDFMESIRNSIYAPYNREQQSDSNTCLDLYPKINDILKRLSPHHYVQIDGYGLHINKSNIFGEISTLNDKLIELSKYFKRVLGMSNLCIPLFFDIVDGGEDLEQAILDFNTGCKYLTNLIVDTHAFIMYIDSTGNTFIFDPHIDLPLIALSEYNPLKHLVTESKLLKTESKQFILYGYDLQMEQSKKKMRVGGAKKSRRKKRNRKRKTNRKKRIIKKSRKKSKK